ncbi:hypothetical protein ACIBQX_40295 [Nonomuraea sp. NPDC049714]|uniref:hypothetical protein n=1 Tax=Nonomuraea sp. NPDC049714 TaxID=3364357 RepID=UPI0037AD5E87
MPAEERRERIAATVEDRGFVHIGELSKSLGISRVTDRGGGTVRPLQHFLVNPLGTGILEQINADTAFLGCDGVHPCRGFTNLNLPEAELKQVMIRSSARWIMVTDGSKVGRVELAPLCELDDADLLITGASADRQTVQDCRDAGLDVEVAEEI